MGFYIESALLLESALSGIKLKMVQNLRYTGYGLNNRLATHVLGRGR
jgi:hypothetical protein